MHSHSLIYFEVTIKLQQNTNTSKNLYNYQNDTRSSCIKLRHVVLEFRIKMGYLHWVPLQQSGY